MPDPLLYLQGMGVAAFVSALCVLATAVVRRPVGAVWRNLMCVVGISLGLAAGLNLLTIRWNWPPANGLNRLLVIVLPALLAVELVAGFQRIPIWFAWILRICLAAAIPRILLHGSVYLSPGGPLSSSRVGAAVAASGLLLAACWWLLARLSQRTEGFSVSLAICLATLCAGVTIMMAGYLKGGGAAFPVVGVVAGAALGFRLTPKWAGPQANAVSPAVIGVGLVALFGLLFVGTAFGRLSIGRALVMLLTPLLCWSTELTALRLKKPWSLGLLRLALVVIPLLAVFALAKRDFNRSMAPLLSRLAIESTR